MQVETLVVQESADLQLSQLKILVRAAVQQYNDVARVAREALAARQATEDSTRELAALLQAKEKTTWELLQAKEDASRELLQDSRELLRPKRRPAGSCFRPEEASRELLQAKEEASRELLQASKELLQASRELLQAKEEASRELLQAKEEASRELLQAKQEQWEAMMARNKLESQIDEMKSQMARYAVERDTECSASYARVIIEWFELARGIEQPRGKGWKKFLEENPEFKNMLDTTCGEQFDGDWHAGAKKAYTILSTRIHNSLPVLRGDNVDERILRLPNTMPTWIGCLVRVLAEDLMHMKLAVQFVSTSMSSVGSSDAE